jgi:hypothetical protein
MMQATPEERREAMKALAKYDLLNTGDERKAFVKMFLDHGAGSSKDSLKFHFNFSGSIVHTDTTAMSSRSDYHSVGEILGFFGRTLAEFPSFDEALEDVKYLVAKNAQQEGWTEAEHPAQMDADKPQYSRFWFCKSGGKTESWKSETVKKLTGQADLKDDPRKLQNSLAFMEGLGYEASAAESSSVLISTPKWQEMISALDPLKFTYLIFTYLNCCAIFLSRPCIVRCTAMQQHWSSYTLMDLLIGVHEACTPGEDLCKAEEGPKICKHRLDGPIDSSNPLNSVRLELKKLSNWQLPFLNLKAHFQVRISEKPSYQEFLNELVALLEQQQAFSVQSNEFIVACENLHKLEVLFFSLTMICRDSASCRGGP